MPDSLLNNAATVETTVQPSTPRFQLARVMKALAGGLATLTGGSATAFVVVQDTNHALPMWVWPAVMAINFILGFVVTYLAPSNAITMEEAKEALAKESVKAVQVAITTVAGREISKTTYLPSQGVEPKTLTMITPATISPNVLDQKESNSNSNSSQ
jgi:hypothetical protein